MHPPRDQTLSMPPRLAALATLFAATAAIAAPVRTPHVEAELVAERTAVVPGEPLTVALRLAMIPRWHTYWRNPGDSGEPTRIDWRLPAGFAAGPIEWPVPRQIPVGPLMNYGYEGEVLLLSRLTPPADLPLGRPVTLAAKATWLVCEVQCIPEEAELSLVLPAASTSGADPRWAKSIAAARAELPAPPAALSGWHLSAHGGPGGATLALAPPAGAALRALTFFPFDEGKIEPAAPQRLTRADEGYRLQLAAAAQPVGAFTRVAGILVSPQGFGPQAARAVTVDVPIEGAVTPAVATPIATHGGIEFGLALALVAAFGGGLLLNLMPCVLPVLSIKVLGFADQGAAAHAARRRHGLLYAAGVVASFWLLAGLLLGLRSLGEELGWGFQLQSPPTVAVLALFFFVLGLNLSGVFEFGQLLPSRAAAWRARHPALDWFLSGVLAVLVASPCTAPFMGAALGYAVGEGGGHAFAVFTALGVGMALPYAVLAWFPAWLRRLPKPGPWMERLQQLLAFPLYATAVWLAWVLGLLAGIDAVIWLLAGAVLAAAAAWVVGGSGVRGRGALAPPQRCSPSPRSQWRFRARRRRRTRRSRPRMRCGDPTRRDRSPRWSPTASRCSSTSPPRGA